MKELPKSSIDYYLLPNKVLCSMVGLWPVDEKSSTSSKLLACFRFALAAAATCSVIVPEILMIAVNWGDLQVLTGVGIVLTTMGQLLFKMFYLLARTKKVNVVYDELRDLWDSSDVPRERQSYEEFAYWARKITVIFYLTGMCNVLTFTLSAAFDYIKVQYNISNSAGKVLHLPFDVWYGIDISESPRFEIAFVIQVIANCICCAGICGLDATFMTIILHICGQFKLIKTWITNIGTETNYKATRLKHPQEFEANLIRCISHHQRIINVVKEVNNLLTPIIFMQLLTSGVEFCLSGFAVINNSTGLDVIKFMFYLISLTMQLSVWCWPGEILVHESQQVGDVVYSNVPWYYLPSEYRRQLCLMIVRSQQYCSITALTFQTLSIHTLTTVFNTAASYFTLLRQMQQE